MARRYLGPERDLIQNLVVGGALTVSGLATVGSLAVTAGLNTSILNAGTLGVARGGTGLATVAAGSFLTGNGTGAFSSRTPAQARSDIGADDATNLTTGTVNLARLPAGLTQRIATDIVTSDSSSGTGEIVAATVVASLVAGRTYRVTFDTAIEGGALDHRVVVRIREDNAAGTAVQVRNCVILHTSGTAGNPAHLEGEFTAVSTGAKTFVGTFDTAAATAVNVAASADFPTFLYVDYIGG